MNNRVLSYKVPNVDASNLPIANNSTIEEAIVNKLLDFEVPKINEEALPEATLTPVFHDSIGFSRAPVSFEIKKLKQDNESMLKCLRGEIPASQGRIGPQRLHPMIDLRDGCWKV